MPGDLLSFRLLTASSTYALVIGGAVSFGTATLLKCIVCRSRKYRDHFMGRGRVRDFCTSWWCIINRTSERTELVRFLIQTTRVKIPYKPPAHEVIYLFHTFWVNISSFYLGKLLFIYKKWPANLRNKSQLKPNALKNTSFVGHYKCCELKYWQKIDQKWKTIYWLKTVYDDYIIKWPLKHRIVTKETFVWLAVWIFSVQSSYRAQESKQRWLPMRKFLVVFLRSFVPSRISGKSCWFSYHK